jgi:hypothetical protein
MMLVPGAADQEQNEHDNEPLLRLSENEEMEKAFHRSA